jgi:hypothetical protein
VYSYDAWWHAGEPRVPAVNCDGRMVSATDERLQKEKKKKRESVLGCVRFDCCMTGGGGRRVLRGWP